MKKFIYAALSYGLEMYEKAYHGRDEEQLFEFTLYFEGNLEDLFLSENTIKIRNRWFG